MTLAPLLAAPFVIQLHVAAAVLALALCLVQVTAPKGTVPHRLLGWITVVLIATVALSSFFIHTLRMWGQWSVFHILAIVTLVALPLAVWRAHRHQIEAHRRGMIAIVVFALVLPALVALWPDRIMHLVLFGGRGDAMGAIYLILLYSTPAVIALATIEALVLWRVRRHYDWRAYLASLADLLIRQYLVYAYLSFSIAAPLIGWAHAHRLATLPLGTAGSIAALFVGQEFCYYWFHRTSHRIRLFWASHAVHHSTNEMNLSAAFRFGWVSRLIGTGGFFVPLVWLGFPPTAVFVALNLNLLYQFLLHVDWVPRLGPLEYLLNTPSHHRVHHAANPEYLDRNYGGVLIVFDRLFGTFAAERDGTPCRYGLVEPLRSNNPVRIAFHEILALARDLHATRGWRRGARLLFGPPDGHEALVEDCAAVAVPAE
jgi:sterol desaturase/sphingolipid hydroxylase (fatty acid hydroxylase superfamily)